VAAGTAREASRKAPASEGGRYAGEAETSVVAGPWPGRSCVCKIFPALLDK